MKGRKAMEAQALVAARRSSSSSLLKKELKNPKKEEEVIPAASKASRDCFRILKSAVPFLPRRNPIAAPQEAVEWQSLPWLLRRRRRGYHRRSNQPETTIRVLRRATA